MKNIYKNSEVIVTFMNKAQQKIAELATLMVARDNKEGLSLALELLDFIESLDNRWYHLTEDEIDVFIQYYNTKANLNSIPFLRIVGYKSIIRTGDNTGSGGPWSVHQLWDYFFETQKLIDAKKHNTLLEIQGGRPGEYYHLTFDQWTKLIALISKEPTVGIQLLETTPAAINGIYERGTSITGFRVMGTVVLNDGGVHTDSKYLLNEVEGVHYELPDPLREWHYIGQVTDTSVVTFQAYFTQASMKQASLQLKFELPYYTGLGFKGQSFNQLTDVHKHLVPRTGLYNGPYNIANGNAVEGFPNPVYPYVAFPTDWGLPKEIGQNGSFTFNYISSFKFKGVFIKELADGTLANYSLLEYVTATQGTPVFNFRF